MMLCKVEPVPSVYRLVSKLKNINLEQRSSKRKREREDDVERVKDGRVGGRLTVIHHGQRNGVDLVLTLERLRGDRRPRLIVELPVPDDAHSERELAVSADSRPTANRPGLFTPTPSLRVRNQTTR